MAQLGGGWWELRPRPTTRLKKGKLIGAKSNRGFVDTFNWMLAWIANFDVGAGLSLTGSDRGQPKLELNLVDGNGVPVSDGDPAPPYDITYGAGGGGTTGSFAYKGGVIGPGAVMVGRQAYLVNEDGFEVSTNGDHNYRVKVDLSSGGVPSITVESGSGFASPPSTTVSYFPLYTIVDGVVTADYRGTFVLPVWEMVT